MGIDQRERLPGGGGGARSRRQIMLHLLNAVGRMDCSCARNVSPPLATLCLAADCHRPRSPKADGDQNQGRGPEESRDPSALAFAGRCMLHEFLQTPLIHLDHRSPSARLDAPRNKLCYMCMWYVRSRPSLRILAHTLSNTFYNNAHSAHTLPRLLFILLKAGRLHRDHYAIPAGADDQAPQATAEAVQLLQQQPASLAAVADLGRLAN